MNKYHGLLELKYLGLPCIEWYEYSEEIILNENCKWTVRVANRYGKDTSLPYKIGISAPDAYKIASSWIKKFDFVIISEYFEAKISGNLLITYDNVVIEWVKGNSTDLTRKGVWEENIQLAYREDITNKITLLDKTIFSKLIQYAICVRNKYLDILLDRMTVILEWSIIGWDESIMEYNYKENEIIFYDLRMV